jgi:hypothetical protein
MTGSPTATLAAFAVIKQAELLKLRVPPYPTRARQAARLLLPRVVGANLGLYPIVTSQHRSTTLYQVFYYTQSPFF